MRTQSGLAYEDTQCNTAIHVFKMVLGLSWDLSRLLKTSPSAGGSCGLWLIPARSMSFLLFTHARLLGCDSTGDCRQHLRQCLCRAGKSRKTCSPEGRNPYQRRSAQRLDELSLEWAEPRAAAFGQVSEASQRVACKQFKGMNLFLRENLIMVSGHSADIGCRHCRDIFFDVRDFAGSFVGDTRVGYGYSIASNWTGYLI